MVPSAQLARYVLFKPIGPIGSSGPIGAKGPDELVPIGPIGSIGPIGAICPNLWQLGQLVPRAQLVRYVPMKLCQLGQMVPSAQLVPELILMPIGPMGSTGPIGAKGPDALVPNGPIGYIGPIGAISPIHANWANWFHGPNWCDMYYLCQSGHLVPRAQLARDVLYMPIGPIGSTGPIGAICPNELMPIGPIGSIGPIGAICTIQANWAN